LNHICIIVEHTLYRRVELALTSLPSR